MDSSGDGKIDTVVSRGTAFRLKGFDSDGDGQLTGEELAAAFDEAVKRASSKKSSAPIIPQFVHSTYFLWRQYNDTVLELALWPSILMLVYSLLLCVLARLIAGTIHDEDWFLPPPKENDFIVILSSILVCFNYLISLTTFLRTFFLGQTYKYWRTSFGLGR